MTPISRRSFLARSLALSAALPFALRGVPAWAVSGSKIPVGLELYSVRDALKKDPEGTVRAVAAMGYECVEFYAPYHDWTNAQAEDMAQLLAQLKIKSYSTHNGLDAFDEKNILHTRDLNKLLGCKYVVLAWSDPKQTLDGWKVLADKLNAAAEQLEPAGLKVGYHNQDAEWRAVDGKRPMEILAANTKPSVMLQLDVGTCLEGGGDPVAWIRSNPGRIRSLHCKDWSRDPAVGYKTLFGEGVADWKGIFSAAESVGGVEYYLVEQEGSRYPELETAQRCLAAFRTTHG